LFQKDGFYKTETEDAEEVEDKEPLEDAEEVEDKEPLLAQHSLLDFAQGNKKQFAPLRCALLVRLGHASSVVLTK